MRAIRTWGVGSLAALLAALAPLAAPRAARAAAPATRTLQVFAAASLSDAFSELGRTLEGRMPGLKVQFNFAGSQQLAAQLEQGANADVFASADDRWMDVVRGQGLLGGDPAVFARNRLVVIVPRTNPARITSLAHMKRSGIKLVLAADAVPAGRYARTVLRNLSTEPGLGIDYAQRVLRNVVSNEENVKAVVAKVQLGEADAGMVYESDITPSVARFVTRIEIPPAANVIASYPIAPLKAGPQPDLALAFVNLVRSPEGQQVLQRHRFLPATEGAH